MRFEDVKILNGDEEIDAELIIYAEPRDISVGEIVCVTSKDFLRSTHVHFRFSANGVPMRGYAVMRDSHVVVEPGHLKHFGEVVFDILWVNGPQEKEKTDV